jgi:hypothetical protein
MAFLTFGTTNILNGYAVFFARFQIFMEPLVNAVELIAISAGIREIDLGGTVAIDTPAHAHIGELFYFVHFLDRTVTGLALYFTSTDMLCMAEEYVVGKIVDLGPFYRLGMFAIIAAGLGIITRIAIELLDLSRSVYFAAIFAI